MKSDAAERGPLPSLFATQQMPSITNSAQKMPQQDSPMEWVMVLDPSIPPGAGTAVFGMGEGGIAGAINSSCVPNGDVHTLHTPPPLCDIGSGCCFFTGPWTVTRSSLRVLRRVAAFCRPLRPVFLLVSFSHQRSPVVDVPDSRSWSTHCVCFEAWVADENQERALCTIAP